jgi:hypothetical protein
VSKIVLVSGFRCQGIWLGAWSVDHGVHEFEMRKIKHETPKTKHPYDLKSEIDSAQWFIVSRIPKSKIERSFILYPMSHALYIEP